MSATATTSAPATNASPSRRGFDPNFKMPAKVEPTKEQRIERKAENWAKNRARSIEAEWNLYVPISWDPIAQIARIQRTMAGLPTGEIYAVNMRDLTCTCYGQLNAKKLNAELASIGLCPSMTCKHVGLVDVNCIEDPQWLERVTTPRVVTTEYGDPQ